MRHVCSIQFMRRSIQPGLVSRRAVALFAILAILSVLIVFVCPIAFTQLTVIRSHQSAPTVPGLVPATVLSSAGAMIFQTLSLVVMRRYTQARGRGPTLIELTCSRVC